MHLCGSLHPSGKLEDVSAAFSLEAENGAGVVRAWPVGRGRLNEEYEIKEGVKSLIDPSLSPAPLAYPDNPHIQERQCSPAAGESIYCFVLQTLTVSNLAHRASPRPPLLTRLGTGCHSFRSRMLIHFSMLA